MSHPKNQTDKASSINEQLSLYDSFIETIASYKDKLIFSSEEIDTALADAKRAKERYVAAIKEDELRRKEQSEKERRESERISRITSMELPLDWENSFSTDLKAVGIHASNVSDGLILSLTNLGIVDIEYISAITGEDMVSVINSLKGSIYQDPDKWGECFYKGWETADEYLSGNLRRKWKTAVDADKKYHGYFSDNIRAIEAVMPESICHEDIYITLGSPWVPSDVIDEFMEYLFGKNPLLKNLSSDDEKKKVTEALQVRHDELTGSWEIPVKSRYDHSIGVDMDFGTPRMNALQILENTLNMKNIAVYDVRYSPTGKTHRVLNRVETISAVEKQYKMKNAFNDWVWSDKNRKEHLERIYEDKYSCIRKRHYDGSFLSFPGMSDDIELYPYQKNAAARIIFSPNTLLAHDVGSGKTYTMIAAAMEMKRMGISKKNMFAVPNNIVGQWKRIFEMLYPSANILCIEPSNFIPEKRINVLKKIRDNDFDGIIMAYSCFEQIPVSTEFVIGEYKALETEINNALMQTYRTTTKLRKKKEQLSKIINELIKEEEDCEKICFDDLGISRLFVDEAHNFKNVPIDTKMDKVLGISPKGSSKCRDMLFKIRSVQKKNNGGGVILATATPITNSITDAYIMQSYLQSGELALLDLQSFDSWVGMFAEKVTEFEIDVDTSGYRLATRFSRFHNLPELTAMLSSVADFHCNDKCDGIPEHDGYNDVLISPSDELRDYIDELSIRADDVRNGYVSRKDDNMLKISGDGRKAALDMRLIEPNLNFSYQSKVSRCADNVFDIWLESESSRSTQLIFCDTSTPKTGFNMYDELKRLLVKKGIPENEIAFIHDAENEKQRTRLFSEMRKGDVRILIGSTFKLGLGVNVQDKLLALHHLDIPWRPADMTQREGRILRQGNTNPKVKIFRYITEGSFDAYSWQLLETKQRFISDLLSGAVSERSRSDIENTVLNYAEIKALAIGDPLIKKRIETSNELTKFISLQKNVIRTAEILEAELSEIPKKLEEIKCRMENSRLDIERYKREHSNLKSNVREKFRNKLFAELSCNIMKSCERELFLYQGFSVILPADMMKEKPFIYLQGNERYYVELGESKSGYLVRIDNFLKCLPDYLKKLERNSEKLIERKREIEKKLAHKEDHSEQIRRLKSKLEKIDEELGVNANEQ
ncbi:MAG: helicase-related protein [Oscillospiraceae bacterium]